MIFLGHEGMFRPNEVSKTTLGPVLTRGQITFTPTKNNPTDLTITLYKSKTNQIGRPERTSIPCRCHKKYTGIWVPCTVHHMLHYLKMRDTIFGKNKSDPLFPKNIGSAKGKPFSYANLYQCLKDCIRLIRTKSNIYIKTKYYSPHCLRVGGCVDMARNGEPGHMIHQQGRWSSDMWKKIYLSLDWQDISALSGKSISELKHECNLMAVN